MSWVFACVAFGALASFCATPALADKQYPATVESVTGSPITVTKCEAWARDIHVGSLGFNASSPNMLSDIGITFTNSSEKTITALRLEVTSYDMTNALIGTSLDFDTDANRSADKMAVAPGASFDLLGPRSWHPGYNIFAGADHVTCAVTAVKYFDGTVWIASARPSMGANDVGTSMGPGSGSNLRQKVYRVPVLANAQSPAKLTACTALGVSYGGLSAVRMGFALTNASHKTIADVKVDLVSYDSAGHVLWKSSLATDSNKYAANMSLPPGGALDLTGLRGWIGPDRHPYRDHMSCAVSEVFFSDGNTWVAPALGASK